MLRQFRDNEGSIHFIQPDQTPNPEWVELEVPLHPDPSYVIPYQYRRMNAYPSTGDQLDMLWHMMDAEVIPGKGSDWYTVILSVKNEHPKPE
jgi:hypothetical protein